MTQHANRLRGAASPYLRQHAHQAVDWYPWGPEAFAAARERDVPLLVSIGYAACHWCHVMSHESFDDPDVAARMNAAFVNVKVDREERPDVDAVYMSALQALTGSGGWPMTVVTTPDGRPWFAGTYFPPVDRHGLPAFTRVLDALRDAWHERRDAVVASSERITAELRRLATPPGADGHGAGAPLDDDVDALALAALRGAFDERWGGFGGAPKFPPHTTLRWLLERPPPTGSPPHAGGAAASGPSADRMVHHTLRCMTDGGIHDQLVGGFARYAVDVSWTVPHFEKMLYDNALLLPLLARAGARFGDERLARAAEGVLDWALGAMRPDAVTFAASLDADAEGEEGRFATFTPADLDALFDDADDRAVAAARYGIEAVGPVEGRSVLVWRDLDHPELARALAAAGGDEASWSARLDRVHRGLLAARRARVPPALDDKVITSWNALMVRGLAEAVAWLPDAAGARAQDAALRCADAVWARAWDGERLRHLARSDAAPGVAAGGFVPALLEDAVAFALASLALHRVAGRSIDLERALLLEAAIERGFADGEGGYHTTHAAGEPLVVRPRSVVDGPTPSEYGMLAELQAWLAAWTADASLADRARRLVAAAAPYVSRAPSAIASLLSARARLTAPPVEIVIGGPEGDPAVDALLAVAAREAPDHALVGRVPVDGASLPRRVPWFEGRSNGRPSASVCRLGTCTVPLHEPAALAAALRALRGELAAPPRP